MEYQIGAEPVVSSRESAIDRAVDARFLGQNRPVAARTGTSVADRTIFFTFSSLAIVAILGFAELPTTIAYAASLMCLAILAGMIAAPVVDGTRLYSPLIWIQGSFTLLFLLRPLHDHFFPEALLRGQFGHDPRPGLVQAELAAAIGLHACTAGYLVARRNSAVLLGRYDFSLAARNASLFKADPPATILRRARIVALCATTLFGGYIATNGGLSLLRQYLVGRTGALEIALHGNVAYFTLAPIACIGPAILLMTYKTQNTKRLILALVSVALFPFMGTGARSVILPIAISLGLAWWSWGSRRASRVGAMIVSIVLIMITITMPRVWRQDSAQQQREERKLSQQGTLSGLTEEFIGGADTAMIDSLAILVQAVPGDIPFEYGKTYFGALARPVPRAIWASKPISADEQVNAVLFPATSRQRVGFSFSILGEPYLNGGLIGVGIVLGIFGWAYGRLASWALSDLGRHLCLAVLSATIPFTFVFARGGIGVDYQRMLFVVLPLLYVSHGVLWGASRGSR